MPVGALRRGVELIRQRGDVQQAQWLETGLSEVVQPYRNNVFAFDAEAAQVSGRLRVPQPEPGLDKQIAATALIHDLTVVKRSTADFASNGARLKNPLSLA